MATVGCRQDSIQSYRCPLPEQNTRVHPPPKMSCHFVYDTGQRLATPPRARRARAHESLSGFPEVFGVFFAYSTTGLPGGPTVRRSQSQSVRFPPCVFPAARRVPGPSARPVAEDVPCSRRPGARLASPARSRRDTGLLSAAGPGGAGAGTDAKRLRLAHPNQSTSCGPGGGCAGAAGFGLRLAHATAKRPARTPHSDGGVSAASPADTPRSECGVPTADSDRHDPRGVLGAPGTGHRRLVQAPDRDCARAQRRDSPRLAPQCTMGRRERRRHRGGFVGAVERPAASRSDLPPAAPARPGSAETPARPAATPPAAGLRLAAPAAPGSGRSSSPRPALLAAGPGAGRALGATAWRWA